MTENESTEPVEAPTEGLITTPLAYENEHLRSALAQTNDELIRVKIALKFQGEIIDALRTAMAGESSVHMHDDGEVHKHA